MILYLTLNNLEIITITKGSVFNFTTKQQKMTLNKFTRNMDKMPRL